MAEQKTITFSEQLAFTDKFTDKFTKLDVSSKFHFDPIVRFFKI